MADYHALRAWLDDPAQAGLDDPALLARLNAVVAGTRPAPMSFTDLMSMVRDGAIGQASFLKLWQHARFQQFYSDVMTNNNYAVANLYPFAFEADGTLSAPEAAALASYAGRTVPDHATGRDVWGSDLTTAADLAAARRL